MKKGLKCGRSHYYKPTPKKMRKLGDALLALSIFISASTIMMDHKWIALTSVVIGGVGKFITNLFEEDEQA